MGEDPPAARPKSETHAYSLDEIMTMIDALGDPFAATLIGTAAFTGARRRELRAMRWEVTAIRRSWFLALSGTALKPIPRRRRARRRFRSFLDWRKCSKRIGSEWGIQLVGPFFQMGMESPSALMRWR